MAFNAGPSDVAKAIQLAYQIYEFYQINPKREFADFANDIYNLATHLKSLKETLGTLQANARSAPPAATYTGVYEVIADPWQADSLQEVLGDYLGTLQRAEKLLKAGARGGGITNSTTSRAKWVLSMEPQVIQIRERIHAHSLKITTIVQSMQIAFTRSLEVRIDIAVNHIISVLSRRHHGHEDWFKIPDWFLERLNSVNATSPDISPRDSEFSMRKGLNALILHFNKSTISFSVDSATQNLAPSPDQWINLMKSKYVLDKIKGSAEYGEKVTKRHDLIWSHLIFQLEEKCLSEFRRFSSEEKEDRRLHAPIQDVIEHRGDEEFQLWLKDDVTGTPEPGIETINAILAFRLQSPNQYEDHELSLHRIDKTHLGMQRMINPHDGSRHKTNEKSSIDLMTIKLKPLWAYSRDRQSLTMTYTNSFGTDEVLPFKRKGDMFKFQQAITAYEVTHHELCVETDSFHSKLGSESGQASLQIWREKRIDSEELATLTRDFSPANSPNSSQAPFGQAASSLNSRSRASSSTQRPSSTGKRDSAINIPNLSSPRERSSSVFSQPSGQSSYQTAVTALTKESLAEMRIDEPVEPKLVLLLTVTAAPRRGETYYLSLPIMDGFKSLLFLSRQCKCRKPDQCVHVLLAAKSGWRNCLTAQALVSTPNESGLPSIAALGAYQNNPRTKPPGLNDVTKLLRLELTFQTAARRMAFEEKFNEEKTRFTKYKEWYNTSISAVKAIHT